jgi:hypothetical protein
LKLRATVSVLVISPLTIVNEACQVLRDGPQVGVYSICLDDRPDAMTFVLVDYKGGSAFKDCVHLPHVTGMVTDLDAISRSGHWPRCPPN